MYGEKIFYRDYENLLIKNDALSKENRNLKYLNELQKKRLEKLAEKKLNLKKN